MQYSSKDFFCIFFVIVVLSIVCSAFAYYQPLSIAGTVLLGMVQGLTEFLPISSTAHLLLAEMVLHIDQPVDSNIFVITETLCAFNVIVQAGTIIAATIFFRHELASIALQFKKQILGKPFPFYDNALFVLCCAFLPVGIVGFATRHKLPNAYDLHITAWMLFIGSILMLFAEKKWLQPHQRNGIRIGSYLFPSLRNAVWIGIWQCLALIPGTSRSMSTIVGGYTCRLDRHTSVMFSFLLGLITSFIATAYKIYSSWEMLSQNLTLCSALGGIIVSALVAYLVIKPCISWILQYGLTPFAYYRFALSIAIMCICCT